ncbi:hypothetical protein NC651_023224 [Populus alba x Populus x berolinensis]|nr:hypothetical protein NC651_023224 [Populus alba x Populus x berolinensis]
MSAGNLKQKTGKLGHHEETVQTKPSQIKSQQSLPFKHWHLCLWLPL